MLYFRDQHGSLRVIDAGSQEAALEWVADQASAKKAIEQEPLIKVCSPIFTIVK